MRFLCSNKDVKPDGQFSAVEGLRSGPNDLTLDPMRLIKFKTPGSAKFFKLAKCKSFFLHLQ